MRVGHTGIRIQHNNAFSNLPIELEIFDDGLYIIGITPSHRKYLKSKVVAINNLPINQVFESVKPLISYENEYWLKYQLPLFITKPQILNYVGVTESNNGITFNLENGKSFDLKPLSRKSSLTYCSRMYEMTWLKNKNKKYWFELISNGILYIQYNSCSEDRKYPFDRFVNDIKTILENDNPRTILIDLRLNSGGNSEIVKPLTSELLKYRDKTKIYSAISRKTYSSGRFAVRDFLVELDAILIGEPTGGSPNSYGYTKSFSLPNSRTRINYSIRYFQLYKSDKDYFEPKIRTEYISSDLFNGNDLIIDYVTKNN